MPDIKDLLKENLLALLKDDAGGELPPGQNGTTRLANLAKKKGSWAQRLLNDTDNNLSSVADAAAAFGLQPWQLLVPKLDPKAKPALSEDASAWPFPMVKQAGYWALTAEDRAWVQAKMDSAIKERLDLLRARQQPAAASKATAPPSSPLALALSGRKNLPHLDQKADEQHAERPHVRVKRSATSHKPPQ